MPIELHVLQTPAVIAAVAALPWIIMPLLVAIRLLRSRDLHDESSQIPSNPPKVSIIIPARNEARNIHPCIHAILETTYPHIEVITVDDHSDDGTGTLARQIAQRNPRVHVVDNPSLPTGWFGKQWACQTGASAAKGEILLFVDADTRVGPHAITRSVNAMLRSNADLLTALSAQTVQSFWERVVQPQIFLLLTARYGGTETINRSKNVSDKIANGQFLMFRRSVYEAFGGHALVKSYVAEDLRFAQLYFEAGKTTVVINGMNDISTRMYTTLKEIINGWRKNIYAGGQDAVPFGNLGRWLFPILLPTLPTLQLLPVLMLLASICIPITPTLTLWALITTTTMVLYWAVSYFLAKLSPLYALAFPLGAAVTWYIMVTAIFRGDNVTWKDRQYISETGSR